MRQSHPAEVHKAKELNSGRFCADAVGSRGSHAFAKAQNAWYMHTGTKLSDGWMAGGESEVRSGASVYVNVVPKHDLVLVKLSVIPYYVGLGTVTNYFGPWFPLDILLHSTECINLFFTYHHASEISWASIPLSFITRQESFRTFSWIYLKKFCILSSVHKNLTF